jgi:hypothetical protein
MQLRILLLLVLGLSPLALAQPPSDDHLIPHDCIAAKDCMECGDACDRRYGPKSCSDPRGCWTPKMRNQTRQCFHDVCGYPAEPWHEPEAILPVSLEPEAL